MSATGLISCIRENSPPMEMAANESRAISQTSSGCIDSQKPRRFHPLRNFRRIFRRQTMSGSSASSSRLPQPSELTYTTPVVTSIFESTLNPNNLFHGDGTVLLPVDVGTSSSESEIQPLYRIKLKTSRVKAVDTVPKTNSEVPQPVSSRLNAHLSSCHELATVTHSNAKNTETSDTDFQRCLSETQLEESDCSAAIHSQSGDSVFSESVTVSSVSHGMELELLDIIQKHRNIPDASETNSSLPRSPLTKLQPTNLKEVPFTSMTTSELNNHSTSTAAYNHSNGDDTDEAINYSFSYNEEVRFSSSETLKNLDEIGLNVPSGARLSHAAAHHKMAVRPKKKEPRRHGRLKEPSFRMSLHEVTGHLQEDSTKCGITLVDIDKLLPSNKREDIFQQDSSVISNKSSSSGMECNEKEIESVSPIISSAPCESENICSSQILKIDCNHEFGVCKRFLHRDSRRFENHSDNDAGKKIFSGLANHEIPAINNQVKPVPGEINRKELSSAIYLEANASLFSPLCPFNLDNHCLEGKLAKKVAKLKSGPASRQRVQPKDLSLQALPSDMSKFNCAPAFLFENFKDNFHTPQVISETVHNSFLEKQEIDTELLLNEECVTPIEMNIRKDQILSTLNTTPECLENNKLKNDSLNSSKQSIAKYSMKPVWKQRNSAEKSKSFRYNDASHERRMKKLGNMPSLPDLSLYSHLMNTEMDRTTNDEKELITLPLSSCQLYENNFDNTIKCEETIMQSKGSMVRLKSSPLCGRKNITEIEERIDNLVKSSYVSVLKSEECREKVVTIVPKDISRENELSVIKKCMEAEVTSLKFCDKTQSASAEILIEKHRTGFCSQTQNKLPFHLAQTTNYKSTSSISHDNSIFLEPKFLIEGTKLPEFMKIQLNRIDSPRPKTNLIFSKNYKQNVSEAESGLARKFSNECIEIKTSPQLPTTTSKASSIRNRRSGTIVEVVLDRIIKTPQLEESVRNEQSINIDSKNILKNNENTSVAITGSSLREDSTKIRNKIEDLNAEKKESFKVPNHDIIEKETGAMLRKKILTTKTQVPDNKDDTPELIKVFARRSLKIRDTEDSQDSLKESGNADSNKENHNIETTTIFPRNEITIQPKTILPNNKKALKGDDPSVKSNAASLIQTRSPKSFIQPLRFNAPSSYVSISVDTKRATSSLMTSMNLNAACNLPTQLESTAQISINKVSTEIVPNENIEEFKGILQRRAEWEQRAKEASK